MLWGSRGSIARAGTLFLSNFRLSTAAEASSAEQQIHMLTAKARWPPYSCRETWSRHFSISLDVWSSPTEMCGKWDNWEHFLDVAGAWAVILIHCGRLRKALQLVFKWQSSAAALSRQEKLSCLPPSAASLVTLGYKAGEYNFSSSRDPTGKSGLSFWRSAYLLF